MELYIKIENGEIVEHPLLKENLQMVFPDIDFDNLPDWLVKFKRVSPPMPGVYDKPAVNRYQIINGVATDVWTLEPMTAEERLEKQNNVKTDWQANGFISWVFNEETCSFDPPVPYPSDGAIYVWNEDIKNWEVVPAGNFE